MEGIQKPLSCTRGLHFTKKVGVADKCMYCKTMFINGVLVHQGNIDISDLTTIPERVYSIKKRARCQ